MNIKTHASDAKREKYEKVTSNSIGGLSLVVYTRDKMCLISDRFSVGKCELFSLFYKFSVKILFLYFHLR